LKRDAAKLKRIDLGCSPAAGARRACAC
jgi:hypothetical protein